MTRIRFGVWGTAVNKLHWIGARCIGPQGNVVVFAVNGQLNGLFGDGGI